MGQLAEALGDVSQAIELAPGLPDPWFNRACIHGNRKEFEEAARDMEQFLELERRTANRPRRVAEGEKLLADFKRRGG
jgi:hypothetical protein